MPPYPKNPVNFETKTIMHLMPKTRDRIIKAFKDAGLKNIYVRPLSSSASVVRIFDEGLNWFSLDIIKEELFKIGYTPSFIRAIKFKDAVGNKRPIIIVYIEWVGQIGMSQPLQ